MRLMQRQPVIATHKIILFVVFISAALISSLFVYHLSHKATSALSPDDGLIFPAGRDIKSFELVSAVSKQKFTERDFMNHWTLVFFGFTHCSNVCPTTLGMISKAYDELHTSIPNLQVVLISLDPERDSPEALNAYTQTFHKDFIGVSGKMVELRKLQSQLGIYSARDDSTANSSNYQLQHTSSILLINPQGKWAGLYKFGMNPVQFTQAVEKSVAALKTV
jgi:protein SCO1/2